MGVKNINSFLKEKCPDAFVDMPYSFFRGKRVAVDSDNVFRKLMSRAHKEVVNTTDVCSQEPDRKEIVDRWLFHVKNELIKFLKFGITLVFVFDGAYIDEKSDTQLKRRTEKQKRVSETEELKRKIMEIDELERTPQMVTELRKKMHHLGNIKPEEKDLLCKILSSLGFPILFATGEGEKLCSMLAIEGKVDAVYSRDTDLCAMGCPLYFGEEAGWVYNPETQKTEMAVKCFRFKPILSALKMEYSTFLDLCIMSGCDFNSNIYNFGVKKAYKLLLECKSIDNLPSKFDKSKEILNRVRCREIFQRENSKDICQTEIKLNISTGDLTNDQCNLREFFREIGIEDWLEDLISLYKTLIPPSDIFIEKPPSYSRSNVRLKIINEEKGEGDGEKGEVEKEKEKEKGEVGKKKEDVKEVPKQKASPKKLNQKIINTLNLEQLQRYNDREKEKEVKEVKRIVTLKILPSR